MINTTQNYMDAIKAYGREFITEVTVTDGTATEVYCNASVVITESVVTRDDAIDLGGAFSREAKVTIYDPQNSVQYKYATYTIRSGLLVNGEYEYVPMGTYYVNSIKNVNSTLELMLYDVLLKADVEYVVEEGKTDTEVLSDICSRYDLSTSETGLGIKLPETTDTARNILGYIAGLEGKNAVISRNNALVFIGYSDCGLEMGEHDLKNISVASDNLTVNCITSGMDGKSIEIGTGLSVSYYNPFIAYEQLQTVYNSMCPFTYAPLELECFGNPAVEAGDIITVRFENKTYRALVSRQTIDLNGGCNASILSAGSADNEIRYRRASVIDRKIKASSDALRKSMEEATGNIIGTNGGYFSILIDETTRQPYGFRIMDTATITPTTRGWQGDYNGIGYSNDGFQTISKVALDMSTGSIVADSLISGVVISGKVDINNALALRDWVLSTNVKEKESTFDLIYLKED